MNVFFFSLQGRPLGGRKTKLVFNKFRKMGPDLYHMQLVLETAFYLCGPEEDKR
jgi:hypothetical protein